MSFATATIQGFVTWKSTLLQTPSGRNVVNLLVSVPDKKKETSTSYKLSIWDTQVGSVLEYVKKGQLITATGNLSLEHYQTKNPILRLDFASIADYGIDPDMRKKYISIDESNAMDTAKKVKQKV